MTINMLLIRLAIISTVLIFLSTGLPIVHGQGSNNSEAIITNTGSTDIEGYVITVSRSGDATFKWRSDDTDFKTFSESTRSESLHAKIPMPIVNKLFADLDAVSSVSSLPDEHHGNKDPLTSVTYITYRGQTSPDLSSSENAKKTSLYDDIVEISTAFASKEDADNTAPVTPAQNTRTITLADDNKTIELSVGETIVVDLGSNCNRAVAGMDQGLLDQQQTGADTRSSRRTYRVTAPGIMMLRMVGAPDCATEKSSDGTATQDFQVAIFIRQ